LSVKKIKLMACFYLALKKKLQLNAFRLVSIWVECLLTLITRTWWNWFHKRSKFALLFQHVSWALEQAASWKGKKLLMNCCILFQPAAYFDPLILSMKLIYLGCTYWDWSLKSMYSVTSKSSHILLQSTQLKVLNGVSCTISMQLLLCI
jgi:hypothetical protein